jgi:RNA polymerase sigma factor (sigma-70 family)
MNYDEIVPMEKDSMAVAEMNLKNRRLIKAREELEMTQSEVAEQADIGSQRVSDYECLNDTPWGARGLKPTAENLAEFYGFSPNYLFPRDLYDVPDKYRSGRVEVPDEKVREMARISEERRLEQSTPSAQDRVEQKELEQSVREALNNLMPRQEKILRLRFFEEASLEEVAEEFEVTKERIRLTEAKALRQLRDGVGRPESNMRMEYYLT